MSESMRSRALRPLASPELLVVSCVEDFTKNPHITTDGFQQSVFLYAPDPSTRNCLYFLVATKDQSSPLGTEHILAIHEPALDDRRVVRVGDIVDSVVVAPNAERSPITCSQSRALEFVSNYKILEFLIRQENSTPSNVFYADEQDILALSK